MTLCEFIPHRITAAWCQIHDFPIEKIFSKALITKCEFFFAVELCIFTNDLLKSLGQWKSNRTGNSDTVVFRFLLSWTLLHMHRVIIEVIIQSDVMYGCKVNSILYQGICLVSDVGKTVTSTNKGVMRPASLWTGTL